MSKIHQEALAYFHNLFHEQATNLNTILNCVSKNVTNNHNELLMQPFTASEVKEAVFSMYPDKPVGVDGFYPVFYQKYWAVVGEDVVSVCLTWIYNQQQLEDLNVTILVLLPKRKNPDYMSDLRPIALCNVIYKVMSKMIANWLKLIHLDIFSENQNAFVVGHYITDSVILAYEMSHYLKRQRTTKVGT